MDGAAEKVAKQKRLHGKEADKDRSGSQNNQRHSNHPGRLVWLRAAVLGVRVIMCSGMCVMVCIRILVITFITPKHQKIHPQAVKRRHKNTD